MILTNLQLAQEKQKKVKDYNNHMGYVHYADMMRSYYEIDRKNHIW